MLSFVTHKYGSVRLVFIECYYANTNRTKQKHRNTQVKQNKKQTKHTHTHTKKTKEKKKIHITHPEISTVSHILTQSIDKDTYTVIITLYQTWMASS